MSVLLLCPCGAEVAVEELDDITECPSCGGEVRKETCPLGWLGEEEYGR